MGGFDGNPTTEEKREIKETVCSGGHRGKGEGTFKSSKRGNFFGWTQGVN